MEAKAARSARFAGSSEHEDFMSNRFMNNMATNEAASAHDLQPGFPRDLADLIRHAARFGGRHGYRVAAPGASGHIYFDAGRAIHAEFGEDCGLRAVNEMLRSGAVAFEPALGSWPAQATLHLSPELLLSLTERDTSRVVRKVDLPVGPPPLPEAFLGEPAELVPPVHPGSARPTSPKRPVSGIMPKLVGVGAAPESSSRPGSGRASGVAPMSASTLASASAHRSSAVSSEGLVPSAPGAPSRPPSVPPVVRARERRSSSTVASRQVRAGSVVSTVAPAPPSIAPVPPRADGQPTTMVRITPQGELLAARGKNAEQVAEAAAFIHGLATAIAADFGRRARANVHLSGNGSSLLVARSEVNDIAAALGPTERVSSLLGKVGLK